MGARAFPVVSAPRSRRVPVNVYHTAYYYNCALIVLLVAIRVNTATNRNRVTRRWLACVRAPTGRRTDVVINIVAARRSLRRHWRSDRRQRFVATGRRCRCGDCDGFQKTLERDRRAPVLQALVRCQAVLRPVPPPAELAHVQGVGPIVLVLEVPLQWVIAAERPLAVRAILWLVDTAIGCRRW